MSMIQLAFQNFKASFKNYLSLIISLAFTILVFFNFQNIIFSDAFAVLGEKNAEYIKIIVQVITLVLVCFMIFFIWYSTNVFLSKRKKEIGIYIFMGLSNQKIGSLYMIETTMIGCVALLLGIVFGIITSQLFLMILMAISEISVDIRFQFTWQPAFYTAALYFVIYLIFVLKGYVNIVRSSVLEMVSAAKKNEFVRDNQIILIFKTIIGVVILGYGYYLANKSGGIEVMGNLLSAVVFVIVGIYFVFGGLVPFIFQRLAKNKLFLYQKERNLWINNVIFRIRKNYRTYAMVCVLMVCSVTALASCFAMKNRYEGIVHFRNTYTYQIMSSQSNIDDEVRLAIEKENDIAYETQLKVNVLDDGVVDSQFETSNAILAYSEVKRSAEEIGLEFDFEPLSDDEIIYVTQLHLMSFITDKSNIEVTINHKTYHQTDEVAIPYLGRVQEVMSFYIVSDKTYESLSHLGTEMYTYNYRITDLKNYQASVSDLDALVSETEENYTAYIISDPESKDIEWVKVLYSVCIFMFMVFVFASGSILFMKLYNDAFEDKERYLVLSKLGIDKNKLKKAIANELRFAYMAPLFIMAVSSYFSVMSLGKVMETNLLSVNIISVLIITAFFVVCYWGSVMIYQKNAGIK